jgi:hypothetical protein
MSTGPSSYKEHGFRMLLIWAHGLGPEVNPVKELYESLTAIGKKGVAGRSFSKLSLNLSTPVVILTLAMCVSHFLVSLSLSVYDYLTVCLSVSVSVSASIWVCFSKSWYMWVCLSVHLPQHFSPSFSMSVCL